MNEPIRNRASHLFRALANPARLRIVELLCNAGSSGMSVNEICAALDLGQSATSQNLAMLAQTGVLVADAKGTSRCYRVRGPRIGRILLLIEEFCNVHSLYGDAEQEEVYAKDAIPPLGVTPP